MKKALLLAALLAATTPAMALAQVAPQPVDVKVMEASIPLDTQTELVSTIVVMRFVQTRELQDVRRIGSEPIFLEASLSQDAPAPMLWNTSEVAFPTKEDEYYEQRKWENWHDENDYRQKKRFEAQKGDVFVPGFLDISRRF